jgi:hypothetical protein
MEGEREGERGEVPGVRGEGSQEGPGLDVGGKTRITIAVDDDVLRFFEEVAEGAGGVDREDLLNRALRSVMEENVGSDSA